jgi:Uma2 family endonuclease
VVSTAKRPATYEDLLQVPDNLIAEIVEGELFTSPRPAGPHERAGGGIYSKLRPAFDDGEGPGGWWIAFEGELHLAADVLVPDLSGWRRARVPAYPIGGAAARIAPDWICEVISPSTGRFDRMKKLPAFARHGVGYAWLVEPLLQTIEVFQLVNGGWTLLNVHGGDETARIEPFEAYEFSLATLWLPNTPAA